MPVAALPTKRHAAPREFVWLSPTMLRQLNTAHIVLYLCSEDSERPVLFRQADIKVDEAALEVLIESKGDWLCIRATDLRDACSGMIGSLSDLVADETLSPADRFKILQVVVSFEVQRTLNAVDPAQYVTLSANTSRHITTLVSEAGLVPNELFAIARHDFQTFTHVTNTAGYAVMLADRLGCYSDDELKQIAMGAMLHDIGKRCIPRHILAKPGRLTDEERKLIQTHPLRGYEELVTCTEVTDQQRLMAYQHHERIDGTGYPVRIPGSEIHPWSKLLSVVDVFEALTGSRPYRRALALCEAADYVESHAGTQFDKEIAECWVAAIKCN